MKEVNGIFYGGFFEEAIEQLPPAELLYISYSHNLTEQISNVMKSKNISKVELAQRMGVSKSLVTKFLSGEHNLSLKSLTKILSSLDVKAVTRFINNEQEESCWVLLPKKTSFSWSNTASYTKEVNFQTTEWTNKERLAA